jgi:hypothetical protein
MEIRDYLIKESTLVNISDTIRELTHENLKIDPLDISNYIHRIAEEKRGEGWDEGYWDAERYYSQ